MTTDVYQKFLIHEIIYKIPSEWLKNGIWLTVITTEKGLEKALKEYVRDNEVISHKQEEVTSLIQYLGSNQSVHKTYITDGLKYREEVRHPVTGTEYRRIHFLETNV